MKKLFTKKLISLIMAMLMIISTLGVVNAETQNVVIKSIIFASEDGKMVYVDYAKAVEESIAGDPTLYNAVIQYVGIAEEKGLPIYLETVDGIFLDYAKALTDNVFRLSDIINVEKYKVTEEIKFTHELWVDEDGEPVITDPEAKPAELISITPVEGIEVEVGTSEDTVIERLPQSTTVEDSKNQTHTVKLNWIIENYNKDVVGEYNATGTFTLPKGVVNKAGLKLKVEAKVKVYEPVEEPEFPIEVENVFIIQSEITDNTYANINIKEEYVFLVETVKVDGNPANKMPDKPAQWRFKVADGTKADDLKGRVSLTSNVYIESLVEPTPITVKVGDTVNMPAKITANMSDGTTTEVPVTWVPATIDTSTVGVKTAIGTVAGFDGTVTLRVIVEDVKKGIAFISLSKDSSSDRIPFINISDFYIKNKETGIEYRDGDYPTWNNKNSWQMKNIPVGKYTIHFNTMDGMYIHQILLGGAYNETVYNAETNPYVIDENVTNYATIVLKTDLILKEIKPLAELIVPVDITYDEFLETLPKKATIIDSMDQEHQVDISWGFNQVQFNGWRKPGNRPYIESNAFKLPINVSNTVPPTRLRVLANVLFE